MLLNQVPKQDDLPFGVPGPLTSTDEEKRSQNSSFFSIFNVQEFRRINHFEII
jgi:hypothetical protein